LAICFFADLARCCGAFMTDTDLNFWGLLAMPVGVAICFGLALLFWLRDEFRAGPEDEQDKTPPNHPL
jgi:hypothetical protein